MLKAGAYTQTRPLSHTLTHTHTHTHRLQALQCQQVLYSEADDDVLGLCFGFRPHSLTDDRTCNEHNRYLRLGPLAGGPGKAQLVIAQVTGLTEISEGAVTAEGIEVESGSLGRVSTSKDPSVRSILRKFTPVRTRM
jgi:hypothetical protein